LTIFIYYPKIFSQRSFLTTNQNRQPMTKVSHQTVPALSLSTTPIEEVDNPDKDHLPVEYVQALNGAVGQGARGSFDRLVAGTLSEKHRTGKLPKGRYDHSGGGS
jgi:hypothetical protein